MCGVLLIVKKGLAVNCADYAVDSFDMLSMLAYNGNVFINKEMERRHRE